VAPPLAPSRGRGVRLSIAQEAGGHEDGTSGVPCKLSGDCCAAAATAVAEQDAAAAVGSLDSVDLNRVPDGTDVICRSVDHDVQCRCAAAALWPAKSAPATTPASGTSSMSCVQRVVAVTAARGVATCGVLTTPDLTARGVTARGLPVRGVWAIVTWPPVLSRDWHAGLLLERAGAAAECPFRSKESRRSEDRCRTAGAVTESTRRSQG